ncbi:hypothetical protein LTR70_003081 [Exophiala xenobiotica]|uniref:RNA polymerase sigma factor 70 region 4 type 2 domain-containing protein n=1 Tax=Lithohypha guttulata TaxID=1690604 RepID=A0ABR0KHL4_9EURO|nr:hypothetical protein LTR24_002686 [Lithohypha guttulata]KAK5323792.1 hypothetical protein LTR70_003081 [Exophiala xenobiotica]
MKPPHGAGFGYPGLISALFRSTDKSVPSIEGHEAIDKASSDGEQVTGVCQERAIRAPRDLVLDLSRREPHPGTATDLSPWALNTYSRESPSSEVSSNATITAPLQPNHATDARNKTAGEPEFENPDDKQQRTGNKRLTRDQRRDILLMRRLGHKYEDIAKFLGVTQAAVQYTINRGRASPEHHNAGRKKLDRAEVPRHANGRKIRSDAIVELAFVAMFARPDINRQTQLPQLETYPRRMLSSPLLLLVISDLILENTCEMSIEREHSPIRAIVANPFHNSANQVNETLNSVKTEPEPEDGSHHPKIKQEPDIKQEPEPEPQQEEQVDMLEAAPAAARNVWIVVDLDFNRSDIGHLPATCQVLGVYRTVEGANTFAISFARFLILDPIAIQMGIQPHITVRNDYSVSVRVHDPVTGTLRDLIEVHAHGVS